MKDEIKYLDRMIWIFEDLENYLEWDSLEEFYENNMKVDACLMKLQVLWETIKKIGKYPDIPYKDIVWMRDWISHDYFWLDESWIYETLKKDIPHLKKVIQKIIHNKQFPWQKK